MGEYLDELNRMVENVTITSDVEPRDIERWQRLFNFSYAQAEQKIKEYRNDLARVRICDEHWEIVREMREAAGHDRESYEYSFEWEESRRVSVRATQCQQEQVQDNAMCVIRLDPPLDSPEVIDEISRTIGEEELALTVGFGETGPATFCTVSAGAGGKILRWMADFHPNHTTLCIIGVSKSRKQLSGTPPAPFLGLDTTLPQHRAQSPKSITLPHQDQYPVWYFFYGNLAIPDELQQRLRLAARPQYISAMVRGARIRTWRGQYRALVDAGIECVVGGCAYLVESKEDEDALRFYETEKYEVVRCGIEMEDRVEPGLVFRFAGGEHELQ